MIKLLKDRMATNHSEYGKKTVFLKADYYDRIRLIPSLGWLVAAGYTGKTSVIRFSDGAEE
jgi:hypothetical protein